MKLTRLCVAELRQFRKPPELADLQPGLNLFAGANEAGKSTLVRAIRADWEADQKRQRALRRRMEQLVQP